MIALLEDPHFDKALVAMEMAKHPWVSPPILPAQRQVVGQRRATYTWEVAEIYW
jgi:hypothetical protein